MKFFSVISENNVYFFLTDGAVSSSTTPTDGRPKKPRRHTTGNSKEDQEDLLIARHFSGEMREGKVINEMGQEIDPSSTLGRKQLIGMLKQRYGQDIENYRSSIPPGEKVRMPCLFLLIGSEYLCDLLDEVECIFELFFS